MFARVPLKQKPDKVREMIWMGKILVPSLSGNSLNKVLACVWAYPLLNIYSYHHHSLSRYKINTCLHFIKFVLWTTNYYAFLILWMVLLQNCANIFFPLFEPSFPQKMMKNEWICPRAILSSISPHRFMASRCLGTSQALTQSTTT